MMAFSQMHRGRSRVLALSLAVSALALLTGCDKELILEGERFDPRTPLEASLPVEGQPAPTDPARDVVNTSAPISLPAMRSNADWTHRAGNNRHFAGHVALSAAPQRIWTANIGAGDSRKYRITATPVVGDGRIFTLDSGSTVSAVSPAGGVLWQARLMPEGARTEKSGGGLAYGAGRVFATTGHGELIALDAASGAVVWRQRLDASAGAAPTVDGGTVYAVARNGTGWAVNAQTGKVLWQVQATPSASGVIGSAGPAVTDTTVILPFSSGEVIAVQKTAGERLWVAPIAGERLGRVYANITDITGDPVVAGAVTYVGNQSGRTAALDTATGQRRWTATEAAYGPVLPVGNSVFLISDEAKLVRLDADTGARVWAVDMPYFSATKASRLKAITAHYGPLLAGGRLIVASGDGLLRQFSPTDGALVGTVEVPGGAASAPALAGGVLYVVSGNGQLHAFR